METTSQNDEKLSLFAHPLTFAITHIAFPILATLACVYLYWITCDALEGVLASKALAVLLAGYPVYVPGTLVIKATMAFLVSLVPLRAARREESRPRLGFMLAAPLAELVMVAGYYLYEAAIVGEGFAAAFAGVPGNAVQGVAGAAGAYLLIELLGRTEFFRIYGIHGFARRKAN